MSWKRVLELLWDFWLALSTLEFLALQEEKTLQQSRLLIRLQDLLSLHVALCLRRLILFPQAGEEDRRGKHHIKFHSIVLTNTPESDKTNTTSLPSSLTRLCLFESDCEPATFGERFRFGFRSWFISPTRPAATMTAMPPTPCSSLPVPLSSPTPVETLQIYRRDMHAEI